MIFQLSAELVEARFFAQNFMLKYSLTN